MHAPCDRESVERRITALRERFGYTEYTGDNVEYHDSGCVTFPLLGTKADIAAKLAFDPDRSKRKPLYRGAGRFPGLYGVYRRLVLLRFRAVSLQ